VIRQLVDAALAELSRAFAKLYARDGLAGQRSRFTHDYFYIRDEVLGPIVMRVATFFPFQATYYLNGHSFIEQELNRAKIGFASPTTRSWLLMTSPHCRRLQTN
jgi:hypothetical protein